MIINMTYLYGGIHSFILLCYNAHAQLAEIREMVQNQLHIVLYTRLRVFYKLQTQSLAIHTLNRYSNNANERFWRLSTTYTSQSSSEVIFTPQPYN